MQLKNKKAQMKIQQMAFMLIAVTLFFVLAGLFIVALVFSGIRENAELLEERNALLLASKLADSPEFSCGGIFGGEVRTNCIDIDKAMALKSRISAGYYSGFWGIDGLEIRWVYPSDRGTRECTSENYPLCGRMTFVEAGSGTGISNFVSLCRKAGADEALGEISTGQIYDKCELGNIIVTYNEND